MMKQAVSYYWSETCDRKAMAEAAAREVREFYPNPQLIKRSRAGKKDGFQATVVNDFLLSASNNLWRKGQWVRYWEERIKAYGAEVRPEGASLLSESTDGASGSNQSGKKLGDL